MRHKLAGAIILLSIVALLSGCGSKSQDPKPSASPSATVETQLAQIYYVGDTPTGFKLFSELYEVPAKDALVHLVSDLVSGVAHPQDPDYSNLWGNGTTLRTVKVVDGLATVDLHMVKLNVGSEAEQRAIDQILWTIAKFDQTVKKMTLLVDGKKIESLAGHVDAMKPFTLSADYEVLNSVQISSIRQSEELVSPIVLSGEACTFEANVPWKLLKDGVVIKSGAVTAEQSCPVRSVWTLDLGDLVPGNYTVVVEDISAKDGAITAQDSKDFVVLKI